MRSPSEKRSNTLVSPFINDIFSSRDLAAKFERSKKFRVEIGREEKKACVGRVVGLGLLWGCRVMSELNITNSVVRIRLRRRKHHGTLKITVKSFHSRKRLACMLA